VIRRARQVLRALSQRCPLCGAPWPRTGVTGREPQCRRCQVYLERHENDSFLGAYTLNLFATLLVTVLVVVANVRWHDVPAPLRYAASALVIAAFPLWFYRRSKLLWLAVDAQFRRPEEKDFDDAPEHDRGR
jgi:uncharacterized protein (DUF983 family)